MFTGWKLKTLTLSTNVDEKSLETEFSIAICRPTGDKWQSKTLFQTISDPRSSLVKNVFDCHLSDVRLLGKQHKPPKIATLLKLFKLKTF